MAKRNPASGESLFDRQSRIDGERNAPLADRMRPRSFEEYAGQEHVVGPDRVLLRSIAAGRLPSFILWGPPGTGKTTLARLVASATQAAFEQVSAVTSGVADLRRIVAEAGTAAACTASRPSSSSTKSTGSTRRSRTLSSPTSKTAPSR